MQAFRRPPIPQHRTTGAGGTDCRAGGSASTWALRERQFVRFGPPVGRMWPQYCDKAGEEVLERLVVLVSRVEDVANVAARKQLCDESTELGAADRRASVAAATATDRVGTGRSASIRSGSEALDPSDDGDVLAGGALIPAVRPLLPPRNAPPSVQSCPRTLTPKQPTRMFTFN